MIYFLTWQKWTSIRFSIFPCLSFQEPVEEDDEEEEKQPNPPMMVPMADMLNHVSNHNANLEYTPVCGAEVLLFWLFMLDAFKSHSWHAPLHRIAWGWCPYGTLKRARRSLTPTDRWQTGSCSTCTALQSRFLQIAMTQQIYRCPVCTKQQCKVWLYTCL